MLEQAAQGGGGVTIPRGVEDRCWILEAFFNLNDSDFVMPSSKCSQMSFLCIFRAASLEVEKGGDSFQPGKRLHIQRSSQKYSPGVPCVLAVARMGNICKVKDGT